jgi:hypothetical protein
LPFQLLLEAVTIIVSLVVAVHINELSSHSQNYSELQVKHSFSVQFCFTHWSFQSHFCKICKFSIPIFSSSFDLWILDSRVLKLSSKVYGYLIYGHIFDLGLVLLLINKGIGLWILTCAFYLGLFYLHEYQISDAILE